MAKVRYSVRVIMGSGSGSALVERIVCVKDRYVDAQDIRTRIENHYNSKTTGASLTAENDGYVEHSVKTYSFRACLVVPMIDYVGEMPDDMKEALHKSGLEHQ
ncbi:MAG: hypothetical protein IPF79_04770 [Ignavibacteria bacterium]|nr:hypothetical protein [Ignavibacteria bacterium]